MIRAHPAKPVLVGRSYAGKPDVKGFKFRDASSNTLKDGRAGPIITIRNRANPECNEKTTYCKKAAAEAQTPGCVLGFTPANQTTAKELSNASHL